MNGKNAAAGSFEDFDFRHFMEPRENLHFVSHDFFEISLMVSGVDEVSMNNEIYRLEPDDLFVTDILEKHRFRNLDPKNYERYCMRVYPEFAMQFCTHDINLLPYFRNYSGETIYKLTLTKEQSKCLYSKFQRLQSLSGTFGESLLRKLCAVEILIYISGFFKNNVPDSARVPGDCVSNVLPIIDFINQNIAAPLYLDTIAEKIHMNKSYMCKLFNKSTGTTINSYIVKKRIAKAKTLLLQNVPATDVCYDVGFNDYSNFARAFKDEVGCSPSNYIKFVSEVSHAE